MEERRTLGANNMVESQKSTLFLDGAGNWQVNEVRKATTRQEGKNSSTEERVSRLDADGKLSEVSRTVSHASEGAPGEMHNTVKTPLPFSMSQGLPGTAAFTWFSARAPPSAPVQPVQKTTEQQVEQPNPGDPASGLQVITLTTDTVRPVRPEHRPQRFRLATPMAVWSSFRGHCKVRQHPRHSGPDGTEKDRKMSRPQRGRRTRLLTAGVTRPHNYPAVLRTRPFAVIAVLAQSNPEVRCRGPQSRDRDPNSDPCAGLSGARRRAAGAVRPAGELLRRMADTGDARNENHAHGPSGAITCASCPAPLGRRTDCSPNPAAAASIVQYRRRGHAPRCATRDTQMSSRSPLQFPGPVSEFRLPGGAISSGREIAQLDGVLHNAGHDVARFGRRFHVPRAHLTPGVAGDDFLHRFDQLGGGQQGVATIGHGRGCRHGWRSRESRPRTRQCRLCLRPLRLGCRPSRECHPARCAAPDNHG